MAKAANPAVPGKKKRRESLIVNIRRRPVLYLMALPVIAYFIIFHFIPMFGVVISFQRYVPARGVFGSQWVGLKHFKAFFKDIYFGRLLRNTFLINVWNLMIMRTFFAGIPQALEESAIIDGADDWVVFTRVILPLSKPIIAVMVLYYGVEHWNSWFQAQIYLRDRKLYPLQLFLREILVNNVGATTAAVTASDMQQESYYRELLQYCSIIVSTVPILCVYPFLQKYFVQGVMIGAIKG